MSTFLINKDVEAFCRLYNIDPKATEAAGLEWSRLQNICEHHESRQHELTTAGMVVTTALQPVKNVHSLKMRVKSSDHLAEKIIRKQLLEPQNPIDENNYTTVITDLVGVRALHLFKEDWKSIHEAISDRWEFHETPKAYVRKGDSESYQEAFRNVGFEIKDHPYGYRSLHYLAKCQPQKKPLVVELQVRTIFEEGWSEIDHRVRYPSFSDNTLLNQFLKMFNRLAGSADEMGSFVVTLNEQVLAHVKQTAELQAQLDKKGKEFEEVIEKQNISEIEKTKLKKQLAEIRSTQAKDNISNFGLGSVHLGYDPSNLLGNSANVQNMLNLINKDQQIYDQMCCSVCGTFSPTLTGKKCYACLLGGL